MENKMERQKGNTMHWPGGFGIVFLFLFFPYMLLVALDKIPVKEEEIVLGGPEIVLQSEKGVMRVPLDEYLCGILAPYLLGDYTEAELEALSVVLRSNLLYQLQNEGVREAQYYSPAHRQILFGAEYQEKNRYLRQLILRTEGCILLHGGKLMEVPVFSFDDAEEDFSTLLQKYYENYTLYYYY
ncbi:MAG: hypothetical protein IJZ00_06565 [Lachnospiraceae bacterium]|nr:hypothetical protein [Lachnospiraceae bacterium]